MSAKLHDTCGRCFVPVSDIFNRLKASALRRCRSAVAQDRARAAGSAQGPLARLRRRLPFPHAVSRAAGPKPCPDEDAVVWRHVRAFIGVPPRLRVATYSAGYQRENDPWHTLVRVWYVGIGRRTFLLEGHADTVLAMALHGAYIITGSYDKTVKVWRGATGELLQTVYMESGVCAVAADGSRIAAGCLCGAILVWPQPTLADDANASHVQHSDAQHLRGGRKSAVAALALHRDIVVAGSTDPAARVYSARSGRVRFTLVGHTARVVTVAVFCQRVITGSADGTAMVWDVDTVVVPGSAPVLGRCELRYRLAPEPAVGDGGGSWAPLLRWLPWLPWRSTAPVVSVAMSWETIATCTAQGVIRVWDVWGQLLHTLDSSAQSQGSWAEVSLSPDGRTLCACWKTGVVTFWDAKMGSIQYLVTGGFSTRLNSGRTQGVTFEGASSRGCCI